ncbi:MAG TPA: pilin [Rhodanobacter sp.]
MNMQRGRSNTTIVVVIVILIVIIAVAYPWWRNHQTAGRVDSALKAADAAKVAVMEAATVHGGPLHIKASELGYNASASENPYVSHIEIADGGRITVTTKDTGAAPDIQLLLTPVQGNGNDHAAISWVCSVVSGNVDATPADCRNADAAMAPAAMAPASTTPVTPAAAATAPTPPATVSPSHSS